MLGNAPEAAAACGRHDLQGSAAATIPRPAVVPKVQPAAAPAAADALTAYLNLLPKACCCNMLHVLGVLLQRF